MLMNYEKMTKAELIRELKLLELRVDDTGARGKDGKIEEKLKISEDKHRRLVESLQDNFLLYSHNKEGVFTYISPSIMNILGYSQEEFLSHYSRYMTDNPNNKEVVKHTDFSLEGIKQPPYEVEIYHNNGSERTLKVQEVPVFDEEGKVIAVDGIAEDITNRKKSEELLQASKNQLQSILDNTTAVIYIKDRDGKYVLVNHQYEMLFKVSREDIIGKTDMDIFPEEIAKAFRSNDLKVLDSGVPLELEEIAPNYDGPHTYLSLKFPLFNSNGTSGMVCGISTDITKRKQAEEILLESKEKYLSLTNDILNSSIVGIFVLDSKFRVVCANKAIERFFGIRQEDIIGKDKKQLISQHIKDIFEKPKSFMEKVIATYDNNTYAERFECHVLSDGKREERYLEHWSMPIKTGVYKGGRIEQYTDITERKKMENNLIELNTRLQEQDNLKSEFLSTVSHEIRTPFTLVLGFISIINKKLTNAIFPKLKSNDSGMLNAKSQIEKNLKMIMREGKRLVDLLDDLLDMSRIEERMIETDKKAVSIIEVVKRSMDLTRSLAKQENLEFKEDFEDELPLILADRVRLKQVLINLINNAIMFTEKGSITLKVSKQNSEMVVSVIDTGIGIAKVNHDKIFNKFLQVGDIPLGKPKGTGLGLSICKQIVESHNGRMWVESNLGKGSNFSFSIPCSSQ